MHSYSCSIQLPDSDSTRSVGAQLGRLLLGMSLAQPLSVHLIGELGAGKTTFVAGLLRAMGHEGAVRSPTYTLIEPYEFQRADGLSHDQPPNDQSPNNQSQLHVIHMDLYRLTDPSQLEELGVRDMLVGNTVLLIEWPDRAGHHLPPADITIHLAYLADGVAGRTLEITTNSQTTGQLLQQSYSHTLRA